MNTALAAPQAAVIAGGEVESQIATARRYPRDVRQFVEEVRTTATIDDETALGCLYFKPRAGKFVEGASIRLAEIAIAAYGNIKIGSRVLEMDQRGEFVLVEAIGWDLEKNIQFSSQCRRQVYRAGKGLDWDSAVNAAASIAIRNVAFRVIPKGLLRTTMNDVRQMVLGSAKDLADLRDRALTFLKTHGVSQLDVERFLGDGEPKPLPKWTSEDVMVIRSVIENVRNGERTFEETFKGKKPDAKSNAGERVKDIAKRAESKPESADQMRTAIRKRFAEDEDALLEFYERHGEEYPQDVGEWTDEQVRAGHGVLFG